MAGVLADLALESEAATVLTMRLAAAFDAGRESGADRERALARIATPVAKYFICKTAPGAVNEAQECIGGNGYIEDSILPRLFRQSPLNSIWEGSGNVQCLDMLRAAKRTPEAVDALRDELKAAAGAHPAFDAHVKRLETALGEPLNDPAVARHHADLIARALQAQLLLTSETPRIGEAFCETRLAGSRVSPHYGGFDAAIEARAILDRTVGEC
jgi:putative acyl-CoA dehydrogenase